MKLLTATVSSLLVLNTDAFGPIGASKVRTSTALRGWGVGSWDPKTYVDPDAAGYSNTAAAPAAAASAASAAPKSYGLGSWNKDTYHDASDPYATPQATVSPSTTAAPLEAQTDNYKSSPRWRKKTKQLATLGPASSTFEMIEKLFLAGADVFRLNFSHGEHAQKKELLDIIRQVEAKYDHPIAILGDLQGPKLRVGQFANPDGEMLQAGQIFRFDLDETPGTNRRVLLPHPEIIEASQVGHVLLIDDGKVKLQVVGTGPGYLDCEVVVPGMIKDRKVCIVRDHLLVHLLCFPSCIAENMCSDSYGSSNLSLVR